MRAFRDAERRHANRVAKLFGALSLSELSTLTRLLDKVREALGVAEPARLRSRRTGARRARPKP